MSDCKGVDLRVGDKVVYIKAWWGSKYTLDVGRITKLTPKNCYIDTNHNTVVQQERVYLLD